MHYHGSNIFSFGIRIFLTVVFSLTWMLSYAQITSGSGVSDSVSPSSSSSGSSYVTLFAFVGNMVLNKAKDVLNFSELDVKKANEDGKEVYKVNVANRNNTVKFSKNFNASKINF